MHEYFCRGDDVRIRDETEHEFEFEKWFKDEAHGKIDPREIRLLRSISNFGKGLEMGISKFTRFVNIEDIIDWIYDMEDLFEFKYVEDPQTKISKDKTKGTCKHLVKINPTWKRKEMKI